MTTKVRIEYRCPKHGRGVTAIDKTWCYDCLIYRSVYTRVDHIEVRRSTS